MKFFETTIADVKLVELAPIRDERGAFARAFCSKEFAAAGIEINVAQANLSSNVVAGTLRGMHFQIGEHAEIKLVRCVRGAIFDVVVDLRPDSGTFLKHFGAELSAENGRLLVVPKGFAHGYQALTPDADVYYLVSTPYASAAERGLNALDPLLAISWPLPVSAQSPRDAAMPLLSSLDLKTLLLK